MIDFYAMHGSVHNTYQKYGRASDEIKLKYMDDRRNAIEKARAHYSKASQNVRVKRERPEPTPLPPTLTAPRTPAEHAAALRSKYGKSSRGGGTPPSDRLVYSASQAAHKAAAKVTDSFGQKGHGQAPMERFTGARRSSPWSSAPEGMNLSGIQRKPASRGPRTPSAESQTTVNMSLKGHQQPPMTRFTGVQNRWGQAPAEMGRYGIQHASPSPSTGGHSTASRPTIRQVWDSGVANIHARRIEQDTRMAQARRGAFGQGATSHSTGHGRRAF